MATLRISDAARAKLAGVDLTVFDPTRIACQRLEQVGPLMPKRGEKPDSSVHHARVETAMCEYEGVTPGATEPKGKDKARTPPLAHRLLAISYQWQRGTKYFKEVKGGKTAEPQIETVPPAIVIRTIMEFSGKWYAVELLDSGADGNLEGEGDRITVSDYDIARGAENWAPGRKFDQYTNNPKAPHGETREKKNTIRTPQGEIPLASDFITFKKPSEAPAGLIAAVTQMEIGMLQAFGVEVVK